ncbi:unnamed protein product [Nyctereutes procyonoides]|uniref:(raccoon dog) hypothetical protein n=1 Tax=Nyctereutes procyonoides TaxID=34880 RepID=A0A811YVN4_NYCPR|nr:unnamed protein product [Nyctereutes procyonoides]
MAGLSPGGLPRGGELSGGRGCPGPAGLEEQPGRDRGARRAPWGREAAKVPAGEPRRAWAPPPSCSQANAVEPREDRRREPPQPSRGKPTGLRRKPKSSACALLAALSLFSFTKSQYPLVPVFNKMTADPEFMT